MPRALAVQGLSVRFGGVLALNGVTLDVTAGHLVAVIGPNGAGKTSLLNAVCGFSRQHATGTVELYDQPTLGRPAVQIARSGVARTFQDPPLIDSETVLENVLVGAHLRLRYRALSQIFARPRVVREERAARDQALESLALVGLADQASAAAGSLPYGARKLIDIARALVCGPRLLLLDEPTSGLDGHEREVVQRLLLTLRDRELSMLVVEHHMDVVRATAHQVVGLQAGTVLLTGTPAEVLDSDTFRGAVVGRTNEGNL